MIALLADAAGSKEPLARAAAMRALVDLHPNPEKILPALRPHLLSADKEVAAEALRTLTGLGQAPVPVLIDAMKVPENRPVIAAVLGAMGEGAKEAVPALIEIVKTDKNSESRKEALMALGAIGPAAKEAVPAAIAALDDRNEKVNYAACFALGKIGPAAVTAEPELKKKLTSTEPLFPTAAAWAIVKIDPKTPDAPQLVPLVMKALDYHQPLVRVGAARTLGHLGPVAKEALPREESFSTTRMKMSRRRQPRQLKPSQVKRRLRALGGSAAWAGRRPASWRDVREPRWARLPLRRPIREEPRRVPLGRDAVR